MELVSVTEGWREPNPQGRLEAGNFLQKLAL